jgi:nitrite reductase (cytochrome c-552)
MQNEEDAMSEAAENVGPGTTAGADRRGREPRRWGKGTLIAAIVVTALLTFLVLSLAFNIFARKQEARNPYLRVVNVDEQTTDPAVWGGNWPREYESYLRTVDTTRTRYGGSEAMPEQKLDRDPWLRRMYSGYAFSIDYRDRRGHAYMLSDQEETERVTKRPQSGSCLHCHASVVPTWRRVGAQALGIPVSTTDFQWDAVNKGFEVMAGMTYAQAHAELLRTPDGSPGVSAHPTDTRAGGSPAAAGASAPTSPTTRETIAAHVGEAHPVSCVDCHDPRDMQLRVTRPGFVRGIQALANSKDPVPHLPSVERWRTGSKKQPYDPNRDASRQEMRSFVCGQCHVEYYCATKETLFFPWDNGLKVEQMEQTYDAHKFPDGTPFMDYKHGETGAPIYKAQHPEFELWSQGIHARAGVACADCHMPYVREGAQKVSDHWVRSPLLEGNINRACQVCHNVPEPELRARAFRIQDRTHVLMGQASAAVVDMLDAINAAKAAGATEEQLAEAYKLQRSSQWRLDFISSENSMGFHADQETARILGESIDMARRAQIAAMGIRTPKAPATTQQGAPVIGVTPEGKAPPGPYTNPEMKLAK